MYLITNSGKLFSGKFTGWSIEEGFIQPPCQMSIYYNYATDGKNIFVLYYVYYCFYWYTSEALRGGGGCIL